VDPGPGPRTRAQQLTRAMGPSPVSEPFVGPRAWVRALDPKKNKNPNKRNGACIVGTPKIYTATGCGPTKNTEMAGVNHLVVYMQPAVKYNTFYIHHPGGAKRPRALCTYKLRYFTAVCIFTPKRSTPAFSLFSLGPDPVVGYIFGAPHIGNSIQLRVNQWLVSCSSGFGINLRPQHGPNGIQHALPFLMHGS